MRINTQNMIVLTLEFTYVSFFRGEGEIDRDLLHASLAIRVFAPLFADQPFSIRPNLAEVALTRLRENAAPVAKMLNRTF